LSARILEAFVSKHLIIGHTDKGANWRLPAETDLEALTGLLKVALNAGAVETVTVELWDDPLTRGELLVNGAVVATALAIELPEGAPVIDIFTT
jgi:hypothetical protein